MPVQIPGPLSKSTQDKFRRMLKLLDLTPYMDDSQDDLRLAIDRLAADEKDDSPVVCPKLTVLSRCCVACDEDG